MSHQVHTLTSEMVFKLSEYFHCENLGNTKSIKSLVIELSSINISDHVIDILLHLATYANIPRVF